MKLPDKSLALCLFHAKQGIESEYRERFFDALMSEAFVAAAAFSLYSVRLGTTSMVETAGTDSGFGRSIGEKDLVELDPVPIEQPWWHKAFAREAFDYQEHHVKIMGFLMKYVLGLPVPERWDYVAKMYQKKLPKLLDVVGQELAERVDREWFDALVFSADRYLEARAMAHGIEEALS